MVFAYIQQSHECSREKDQQSHEEVARSHAKSVGHCAVIHENKPQHITFHSILRTASANVSLRMSEEEKEDLFMQLKLGCLKCSNYRANFFPFAQYRREIKKCR